MAALEPGRHGLGGQYRTVSTPLFTVSVTGSAEITPVYHGGTAGKYFRNIGYRFRAGSRRLKLPQGTVQEFSCRRANFGLSGLRSAGRRRR